MEEREVSIPFDPIARSQGVECLVMRGEKRVYYRFRAAPYYGGIATADAVGCSFLCAYCWSYSRNLDPARFGRFYSPEEVAASLVGIARKKSFAQFRITGSEPILGETSFDHLASVLQILFRRDRRFVFILETNGLMLGYRRELIERLKFGNVHVRVAIKRTNPESFERITGAREEFFPLPLVALRELENQRISAWPAVMSDLFTGEEINGLERLLRKFGVRASLEHEVLETYPFVLENLKRRNVTLKRL